VGIIAPEEADALPVEGGDAVVADSHAMGVAAKIAEHMLRSAEGRLGMDVPFLLPSLWISCWNEAGSRSGAAEPLRLSRSLR
jgi:hypothetical protein